MLKVSSSSVDESSGATTTAEIEASGEQEEESILRLPEHFLISVLKRFNLRERLRLARVCKRFNRFVKDNALWLSIDLRDCSHTLSLFDLKQLIHIYGTDVTRDLFLRGNNDSKRLFSLAPPPLPSSSSSITSLPSTHSISSSRSSSGKLLLSYLDTEFVHDVLLAKCTHLQLLHFEHISLDELKLAMLLPLVHLKKLSLSWCKISTAFFDGLEQASATRIESLNLTKTGLPNRTTIQLICTLMPLLKELVLNQAQSTLGDDALFVLATRLERLERLDFVNTSITDAGVVSLCSVPHICVNLVHLNLSMSSRISNHALLNIGTSLLNLRSLYLTSCFGISSLKLLDNLRHLNYLNLNNTSIVNDLIHEMMEKLPWCEVEFGHMKLLNQKLTWTINGSRNSVCSF